MHDDLIQLIVSQRIHQSVCHHDDRLTEPDRTRPTQIGRYAKLRSATESTSE